ncbi:hypothetical protein D3C87_1838120 [compost metagenome]
MAIPNKSVLAPISNFPKRSVIPAKTLKEFEVSFPNLRESPPAILLGGSKVLAPV